jgi:hypothetical protein
MTISTDPLTDDQVEAMVTRARAGIDTILDQVLDNEDGLARIYAAHGQQLPQRQLTSPDDAGEVSGPAPLLADDIDGSPAAGIVLFELDGQAYTIALSAAREQQLRDALEPYLSAARRRRSRPGRRA